VRPPEKLLDLSVPLAPSASEVIPVEIESMGHEAGGRHLAELVGVAQSSLPGGMAWASERVYAGTHSGTHVDAPFHYSPTCNGAPSRTIDQVPLEWFLGPGVCIHAMRQDASRLITVSEFLDVEESMKCKVRFPEIVLFDTGAAQHYGQPHYNDCGRGISPELIELLCDRGVKVIGTDAWSIDPPLAHMGGNEQNAVWAAHYMGRTREFCAIERLCNLDLLPEQGFWVSCFPVKVHRGSGAWIRAVALFYSPEVTS